LFLLQFNDNSKYLFLRFGQKIFVAKILQFNNLSILDTLLAGCKYTKKIKCAKVYEHFLHIFYTFFLQQKN